MTTATTARLLQVGDNVNLVKGGSYPATNGYGNYNLTTSERFVISREYTDKYTIRREKPRRYSGANSFNVAKTNVRFATPPVDLAAVPTGKIGPDHPDIQWLWERAGVLAKEFNYCSEYDKIADKLGIPGRERNFTVTVDHKGLKVTSKVTARNRVEAEKKVKEILSK